MNMNSLPDLVLRLIFSKVPLQDLLCLGRVCALWRSYQLDITHKVHFLTLLLGSSSAYQLITDSYFTTEYHDLILNDDGTRMYSSHHSNKFSHFTYDLFTLTCVAQLTNNFPWITSLEIAFTYPNLQLGSIVHLLAKLSPLLKSLKMYFQLKDWRDWFPGEHRVRYTDEEIDEFANLLNVINSMPLLEHLTLESVTSISPLLKKSYGNINFYNIMLNTPYINLMDLPIVGRLREFYFKSRDILNIIEESLQSYAVPNDNLRKLGLDCLQIVPLCESIPQLSSKIVNVQFKVTESILPQFRDILQPFSSITKLDLIVSKFTKQPNQILNSASLRQLTHLHLDTSNAHYSHFPISPPLSPATLSRNLFPQLCSVQVLSLTIANSQTESGLESNDWSYLFPNVQVLELVIHSTDNRNTLTIRNVHLPLGNPSSFLSKNQIHKSLSTFVQCPKLHHIYTCEKRSNGLSSLQQPHALFLDWTIVQGPNGKVIVNVQDFEFCRDVLEK